VLVFDAIDRGGRRDGWKMLFAGPRPPARLGLRGELASLRRACAPAEHLSEAERVAAMLDYASRAGFELPVEVADYLLRHGRRDLGILLAVVQLSTRSRRATTARSACVWRARCCRRPTASSALSRATAGRASAQRRRRRRASSKRATDAGR
jgi:hypothetical protein